MNLQKVSVVVPIFKVEKYLNRCVESILNQTYLNIEVILVNDGSPDKCGQIADEYALLDKRVKVVHKTNGGLSDARNEGMEYVTGYYTLFIDSDDWIDKEMIQEMVNISNQYKAEIVQSAFYYAYDDHLLFDQRYYSKNKKPVLLNNKTLMSELIKNEKVKNFAWGKLYQTKLIRDIPFKKGVLFEDVFWAHQVMKRVNTYVIIQKPLFYYYQRNDSIVATYTPRSLDILHGLKERHQFIEENYKELKEESYKTILKTSFIHYNLLLLNWRKDKGGQYRKGIQEYIKNNNVEFKKAALTEKGLYQQLKLFLIHPLLNVFYLLIKKMVRRILLFRQPIQLERIDI